MTVRLRSSSQSLDDRARAARVGRGRPATTPTPTAPASWTSTTTSGVERGGPRGQDGVGAAVVHVSLLAGAAPDAGPKAVEARWYGGQRAPVGVGASSFFHSHGVSPCFFAANTQQRPRCRPRLKTLHRRAILTCTMRSLLLCFSLFLWEFGCNKTQADSSSTVAETTDTSTSGSSSEADPSSSDVTSSSSSDVTSSTSGLTGTPSECLAKFEWECPGCEECPSPKPIVHYACGGALLCQPVEIAGAGPGIEFNTLESQEAAICVLQALRDRTPGRINIVWGDVMGVYLAEYVNATIFLIGDDTVLMNWTYSEGCLFEREAVSRRVVLQTKDFFENCLATPDAATLIGCFTQGASLAFPDPPNWFPPWTLGSCDDGLPPVCQQ